MQDNPDDIVYPADSQGEAPVEGMAPLAEGAPPAQQPPANGDIVYPGANPPSLGDIRTQIAASEDRMREIRRRAQQGGTEADLANNPEFAAATQELATLRGQEAQARGPYGAGAEALWSALPFGGTGHATPQEQDAWLQSSIQSNADRIALDQAAVQHIEGQIASLMERRRAAGDNNTVVPEAMLAVLNDAKRRAQRSLEEAQKRRGQLEQISFGYEQAPQLTTGRAVTEDAVRGAVDVAVAGVLKGAGLLQGYIGQALGSDADPDQTYLYQWGTAVGQWTQDNFPGDTARQHDLTQKVANGFGSFVGFLGPGLAARVVGATPSVATAISTIMGAFANGSEEYDRATRAMQEIKQIFEDTGQVRNFTADEQDRLVAWLFGQATGATEAVPLARMYRGAPRGGVTGRLQSGAVQMGEEGGQEGFQTATGNIVASQTYDPSRPWGEGVVESTIIGGALGGGAGFAMPHRPASRSPNIQPPAQDQVPPVPPQEPAGPQAAISGFYAPAERAMEASRRVQGPAQAWFNDLKKAGVSNDELDWMGFPQWMEENRGRPISREEVAEFVRENGANLVEVRQEGTVLSPVQLKAADTLAFNKYGMHFNRLSDDAKQTVARDLGINFSGTTPRFSTNFPAGVTNPRNFLVQVPGLNYQSPHFGGPTISFIRVGDVAGPNGERVLLVHGNQSELHQEAEKSGYGDPSVQTGWETLDSPRAPVPNAPLKGDRWWQLGLKLALRQAVAEGYDAVAISTADQVKATDGNAPKSLYDSKMPSWLGKYVKPMGGVVEQSEAGTRKLPKTFASRNDALAVYPRGSLTDKLTNNLWAVYSPGRRTIFGRDFGPLIGHVSESSPGVFVAIPVDNALRESLKVDEAQTRPLVRITPQMRESISKGQPLFAAHNSPSSRDPQEVAADTLADGGTYDVPIRVADGILNEIRTSRYLRMVPSDYDVGSLIMLERIDDGHPNGEVNAVFLTLDDTYTSMRLPLGALNSLGAIHVNPGYTDSGRGGVFFFRFDLPGEFGKRLAGELRHEAGHALRSSGVLRGKVWTRLLDHARSLSSMGMSVSDYLFHKGDAYWQNSSRSTTVKDAYTRLYEGRPDFQEVMDQEHVMIMLELHHHGFYSDEQMAPVRDILDAMESGALTGGVGAGAVSEPAMAIAGPRAKTASKGNLAQAQKMAQRGRNPNTIWEATGWGVDPADSKWKWEIDDSPAKLINLSAHLKPMSPTLWQRLTVGKAKVRKTPRWATAKTRLGTNIKLPQILQHPELYKAYPFLQRMSVNMAIGQDIDRTELGGQLAMSEGNGSRIYRPIRVIAASEAEAIDTLLHEIQHYIQNVEGFAPGASATKTDKPLEEGRRGRATFSPDTLNAGIGVGNMPGILDMTVAEDLARSIRRLESQPQSAERDAELKELTDRLAEVMRLQPTDYVSAAGEVEAEAVASRRNLSPLERREHMPFGANSSGRTPIRQTGSFPIAAEDADRRARLMAKLQEARRAPVKVGDNLFAHRIDDQTIVYTDGDLEVLTANLGRFDSIYYSDSALIGPYSHTSADPLEQSRNWRRLSPERQSYIERQVERDVRSRNYHPVFAADASKVEAAKYGMPEDLRKAKLDPPIWMASDQKSDAEYLQNKLSDLETKLNDTIAAQKAEHAQAMAYYQKVKSQAAWDQLNRLSDEHQRAVDALQDQIQDVREEITYGPLNDLRLEYESLRAEADQIERNRHDMRADLAKRDPAFRKAVGRLILANEHTGATSRAEAEDFATSPDVWYSSHPNGWGEEGDRLAMEASPEIRAAEERAATIHTRVWGPGQSYGQSPDSLVGEIGAKGGTIHYGRNRPRRHSSSSGPMFSIGGGGPVSLVSFIRAHGGIKDVTGDLKHILDKSGTKGHIPGIINNKTGVHPDRMRGYLVEAGYLKESGPDQPAITTVNDVYDLVRRAASGEKILPFGEQPSLPEPRNHERDQIINEAVRILDSAGMEYYLTEAEEARVVGLVNDGLSIDDAIEHATMESGYGIESGDGKASRKARRRLAAQGEEFPGWEPRAELPRNEGAGTAGVGEGRAPEAAGTGIVPVTPPPVPPSSGGGSGMAPPGGGRGGRGGPPGGDVIPPDGGRGGPRSVGVSPTIDGSRNWSIGDWARAARDKWYSLGRTMETWWNPINGLPQLEQYRIGRYRMLGRIGHGETMTNGIWKDFKGASKADKKAAYTYLTTRGVSPNGIADPKVRAAAVATKNLFNALGIAAVDRGLISQEALDKYRDQYLPRLYLEHILRKGSMLGFSGNARPSDLGWTKHRGDIDEETRVLMGEILDPGYLAARGIFRMHRDMMIIDFLSEISNNDDWVFDRGLVDFNGKRVSPYFLRAEAQALRERADYEPDDGYRDAMLSMATDMENAAAPFIRENENVPDGYKQIPDSKRYGMLRGMYVRKEIVDDLLPSMSLIPEDANWFEKFISPQGGGGKFNALWKAYHVPLNPSTQFRNTIGNVVLMNLSGMGPIRIAEALGKAVHQMATKGPIYKTAVDMGLKTSGFSEQELRNVSRAWLDAEAVLRREKAWGTIFYPWQIVKHVHDTVLRGAGDLYQYSEGLFKTAMMIDAVENQGMTPEQAFLHAQKWLFDYSDVSKGVRYLRGSPVGVPFASFYYKVLPRLIEVGATKPWRFLPYAILPYVMGQLFMNAWDAHDDDEEKKRHPNRPNPVDRLAMALPEYLRTKSYAFIMPWQDARGRWQFFDFGYLLPWGTFHEAGQSLAKGDITGAMRQVGFLGGPLLNLYQFIASKGTDSFTGRKVIDPRDPTSTQIFNTMQWVWDQTAPPLITSKGALSKLFDAYNEVPDRSGDPGLTVAQAWSRLFGLNVYPVDPATSRGRQISRMAFEIKEAEKRMRSIQRDQSLSAEARRRETESRAADIARRRRELSEYATNSEVHPRLDIQRPRRTPQPPIPNDLIFPQE